MKITKGIKQLPRVCNPISTVGNFDGVHLGHQALLKEVVAKTRRVGGDSVVLTFDPHPLAIVAPHLHLRLLTTQDEKLSLFEHIGIGHVILLEFSSQLAALPPETFVTDILVKQIGIRELCVGNTFRFGKNRAGTIDDLTRLGTTMGFHVTPIAPIQNRGEIVSSSTIRNLVQKGRVAEAAYFLGRHYAIGGVVQRGECNGAALGYPTANIPLPTNRVIPSNGVYATIATIDDIQHQSVSYIGTRPTFRGTERLLEVHILDMKAELYGKYMAVSFLQHMRDDLVFDNTTDLSRQIEDDVRYARQALSHWGIRGR